MIKNVTAPQLAELIRQGGIVLIDVREPCEFESGHIKGALLFPLTHFDAGTLPRSDPAKTVFYCAAGVRSAHALGICHKAGLAFNTHLEGGINSWIASGLPVER